MKFNAAPLGILCVQCVFIPFLAPIIKQRCHLNNQLIRVEAKTQKKAIEEAKVKQVNKYVHISICLFIRKYKFIQIYILLCVHGVYTHVSKCK